MSETIWQLEERITKHPETATDLDWVFWFAWKNGGANKDTCNKALAERDQLITALRDAARDAHFDSHDYTHGGSFLSCKDPRCVQRRALLERRP